MMPISKRVIAEFLGTFWLVLGGCGAAVFAAGVPNVGIGYAGVALAFGLTVLTGAYALGHISGGHFNPAVSVGLYFGKRFPAKDLLPYIIAQVVGGIVAGGVIYLIASQTAGFSIADHGFALNGYDDHSPQKYGLAAGLVSEVVMRRAPVGFAPLAIGLGLTLIHLISIPITNTSVNPARSTGVAVWAAAAAPWAIGQLWLFWVAPIVGGALGGWVYHALAGVERPEVTGDAVPSGG
jgi:aquaporin Z